MKRLTTILLLFFAFSSTNAQRASWWYGNAPGEAAAGTDTLTLTYWNDFILLHIANTGITETGSGVSEWQDRSGNGNHSTQTVDTNRPTVDGSGNVVFDGVDNYLSMSNVWASVNDSSYTIFLVAELASSVDNQRLYAQVNAAGNYNIISYVDSIDLSNISPTWFFSDGSGNKVIEFVDTIPINATFLKCVAASENTTVQLRINGTQKGSSSVTTSWDYPGASTGAALGANAVATVGFLNGKILFFGIANRKFTAAEIATTESELNSFFTIY